MDNSTSDVRYSALREKSCGDISSYMIDEQEDKILTTNTKPTSTTTAAATTKTAALASINDDKKSVGSNNKDYSTTTNRDLDQFELGFSNSNTTKKKDSNILAPIFIRNS